MTNEHSAAAYPIRAVDRVCDLLDVLQRSPDGISLTALADEVAVPKSSVLRYLSALEARSYVSRDGESGMYHLGFAFRPDRSAYVEALGRAAFPHLLKLRDRFDETMNLAILDGAQMLHVEVVESTRSVRLAASRGERAPLHSTATGKAVATMLPEAGVREILRRAGMARFTSKTIVDPDAFMKEVARVAEVGYGVDDCENQPDGRCVGITVPGLPVPAAVSVSAPSARLSSSDVPEVAATLRRHATPLVKALRAVPA